MARRYRVVAGPAFEREVRRLRKRQPRVYESLLEAVELLESDPYNREGGANVRKLVNVPPGEGQFRLRLGDYRLRYDIAEDEVILHTIRPRARSYR
ncbi:MAG: type II toxin-antitoxin system RelE/ParE family toxin [Armatimonadota bacterium]